MASDFYGEEGCCLTCKRPQKKEGCLCYDMKCKNCVYYVSKKYSPTTKKAHCGFAEFSDHHAIHSVDVRGLEID